MWRLLKGGVTDRGRLLHTVVATALAVSLLAGTLMLTDTIRSAFRRAAGTPAKGVDLVVRSTSDFAGDGNGSTERDAVPATVLGAVDRVPGRSAAWGVVWGSVRLTDAQGRSMGANGAGAVGAAWTPGDTLVAGRVPAGPDEVAIDTTTAGEHHVHPGESVTVVSEGSARRFTVVGVNRSAQWVGSAVATFDLATAQHLLGRGDRVDAIAVRADTGTDPQALRASIAALLGDRYEVVPFDQAAREARESWAGALGFLESALLVFAAAALLVGAFVIANTFSIVVAQRSRELGLLRALGAGRAQLLFAVLAEAAIMGLLASLAGVLAGLGTARALLALMKRVGFDLPTTSVVLRPGTAAVSIACGVLVTTLAASGPAWRATRVSPTAASSGADVDGVGNRRRRLLVGGALALAGAGLVLAPLFGTMQPGLASAGLGAAGLLVGLGILVPLLARPAARLVGVPLVRVFGHSARLGRENAIRNPRRTGASAAALAIGITLVGVIAILGASMKASAGHNVTETLQADLVLRAGGISGASSKGVPPLAAARLRTTPGIALVSQVRTGQWGLNGRTETLLAVDPGTVAAVHELDAASVAATARLGDRGILVRDSVAARHGWRVGDFVPMTFARSGIQQIELVGTFAASVRADYVVSLAAYEANYAQQLDEEVRVRLAPGTDPSSGRARIEGALADLPNVDVLNRSEVVAAQRAQVDRLLLPVGALLALAVLIALLGIANTLLLSIRERTREIGLLRSVGMVRSQLRSMIRSEAVIMALLGALSGMFLAVLLGWALVTSLGDLGVTELVLPLRQLVAWVLVATGAGLMAGILPARRAAAVGVLEAVRRG